MTPAFPNMTSLVAAALVATAVSATLTGSSNTADVYPKTYSFANASSVSNLSSSFCMTLTASNPSIVLDYGTEIGGFPFINVDEIPTAGVQIESKYSEARVYLDAPLADGPWTFSNGLSNTFRTETFALSSSGRIQSFFIQGGLRWQSIALLGQGNFTFCGAGIATSNDVRTPESLPGYFESSNATYNDIWALGVRSTQHSCIASGSAPSTWEITEDGAFVRGQAPAQSVLGSTYSNYTLSFTTKIVRGGTGWKVAAGIRGYGQYFVLTSEYPEGTFLNTNRTLLPPNTLVTDFGWSIVNQTSLTTGPVVQYPVPFDVKEGEWYRISTTINSTGYAVSINGSSPIFVSNENTLDGWDSTLGSSGDKTLGTWGFGPFQDQEAYVNNVVVESQNGTIIYQNAMTDEAVLTEYGVMGNTHDVCLDGAKRDRLVWTGDYVHTQRIIAASTNRTEFSTGTLEYALEWQAPSGPYSGFSAMSAQMGASPQYALVYNTYALIDYQFLYVIAFADYYQATADATFLQKNWAQFKTLIEALLPLVDSRSGLITPGSIPGAFFLGEANGTAPSAAFVHALNKAATLATAAGENGTAAAWTSVAQGVADAVNAQLWNADLGTYALSLASFGNTSITATAFPILAGIATGARAAAAAQALDRLRLGIGYKDDSTVTTAAADTQLSPNLSGFLLEALLLAGERATFAPSSNATAAHANSTSTTPTFAAHISTLLDALWPAMLANASTATGAAWEYVSGAGAPGLGAYTSHAHPWGGAPTYALTEYVLGVRATSPGFATWDFVPVVAVTRAVPVDWARGRVPVPGGAIEGSWERGDGVVEVRACGVRGKTGTVRLPGGMVRACRVGGEVVEGCVGGAEARVVLGGEGCREVVFELV